MPIRLEPWGIIPDSPDLAKRLKSASEAKLTPVELNKDSRIAVFSGTNAYYKTGLASCECPDFSIQKNKGKHLPCKHILRLAMELHMIDAPYKSDSSKIRKPIERTDYDPFPAAVSVLESSYEAYDLMYRAAQCRHGQSNGYKSLRIVDGEAASGLDLLIDNELLRPDGKGGYEYGRNAENCRGKLWSYFAWREIQIRGDSSWSANGTYNETPRFSGTKPGELDADGIAALIAEFSEVYQIQTDNRTMGRWGDNTDLSD